ncbi:Alpha/Beta hydrolase protein [Aspergillus cavernicola]|uniref:Alpha/Beta hydrolase protein n=1 Tax=Aspergillus cavernicola TaxID=176166 RepID=A0ABR4I6D0_9EURO
MPIESDLTIDSSRFRPENVTEATKQINSVLKQATANAPQWYEVGAAKYREMHASGQLALPAPVHLPNAIDATLPSRDSSREIPIRIYNPDNGQSSKGVFLHFHGGGFVLGNAKSSDQRLQMVANGAQLTAISVGYRHAPEDPYPAAPHDCIDAAEYLIDHATEYGTLKFMGGESAGACLAIITALRLLGSRPSHILLGLVPQYGLLDLSLSLPAIKTATNTLMLRGSALENFSNAYLPGLSAEERRNPSISPLYEDLPALAAASPNGLPPALFVCGTADPLVDDTILMHTKWSIAGGEAIVKLYSGAPHGFTALPGMPVADEANALGVQFMQEKLEAAA